MHEIFVQVYSDFVQLFYVEHLFRTFLIFFQFLFFFKFFNILICLFFIFSIEFIITGKRYITYSITL